MEELSRETEKMSNSNKSDLSQNGDGHARALVKDELDQLTTAKNDLEITLSDVQSQLERTKEKNLTLQSKCDELEKSLELERRRIQWQQKFYEQKIQQLTGLQTANTSKNLEPIIPSNFYEETIKALVLVQESQAEDLDNMKKFYEEKIKSISSEHETELKEILESSNFQVQNLVRENESIIRDLLIGCDKLFDQLQYKYTEEARANQELKTNSGRNLTVQFNALSTQVKVIVAAGITVIGSATAGWASWGFIIWVWPRLITFAEILATNPETTILKLLGLFNSDSFKKFTASWEEGKSLGECLKPFANTEFFSYALRMAPDLFSHFKSVQHGPKAINGA